MKISKVSILTIVFCLAAIVSIAHAAPMIVLIEDKIDANVNIHVEGSVGPADWKQSYSGPTYLGTLFHGADIELEAKAEDYTFVGESLFHITAPGKFRGHVSVGTLGLGTVPGVEWAGKTKVRVDWTFKVKKGNTSVYLFAEDYSSDGGVVLKLVDLTTGDVAASINPSSFNADDETVTLIDSHVYRLKAYAWARDFGNGDPDNTFQIEFGTSDIIVGK